MTAHQSTRGNAAGHPRGCKTVTLRRRPDGHVAVSFPYDWELTKLLKAIVPADRREWWSLGRQWFIGWQYATAFAEAAAALGHHIDGEPVYAAMTLGWDRDLLRWAA
ncbi:MAG: hypothetical protein JNM77_08850 [Pseudonocardia sp.]|nr:hypothetical protein [Pseudonocardia sp.]